MKEKKQYRVPQIVKVQLLEQQHLMTGSETTSPGPSANFMDNPDVEE